MNCVESVWRHCSDNPLGIAIWSRASHRVDFATFGNLSYSVQQEFSRQQLKQGQVIVFFARPSVRLYAAVAGALGIGCTALFVEHWLRNPSEIVAKLGADAIVVDETTRWLAAKILPAKFSGRVINLNQVPEQFGLPVAVAVDPDAPATITFTSGSTGVPKGVLRTHQIINNLVSLHSRGDDATTQSSPDLCVMNGLTLLHLATGRGSILVGQDWQTDSLRTLAALCSELRPATLSTGPRFLTALLSVSGFDSLRKIYVGGSPTDISTMHEAFDHWPDASFQHVYGSTEVEPISIIDARAAVELSKSAGFYQMLHVGQPLPEVQTKIHQGELYVRSPQVAAQTLKIDDCAIQKAELCDGWLATGDRVVSGTTGMIFQGRMTLPKEQFVEEQGIFHAIGSSHAFASCNSFGKRLLIADRSVPESQVKRAADGLLYDGFARVRIQFDRRHRSRIDRSLSLSPRWLTARWSQYLSERSPLLVIGLIAAGPALAPDWRWANSELQIAISLLCFMLIATVLVLARLNDEIKDFPKDLLDHPARPLPRGLINLEEAKIGRNWIQFGMILQIALLGYFCPTSLWASVPMALWLHLIGHNFYRSKFMDSQLLVSTFLHQLLVVPLYGLPILVGESMNIIDNPRRAISYIAVTWFGSLLFEFARKMGDTDATVTTNYFRAWGRWGCSLLVGIMVLGFCYSLAGVGLEMVALTSAVVLSGLLIRYMFVPRAAKLLEGTSALANLVALWSPTLMRLLTAFARGA